MSGYSIVAESGIRSEYSPLCLEAIKAGRRVTDEVGCFAVTFVTTGAGLSQTDSAPVPRIVEVHIEFRPGEWRCREVEVDPSKAVTLSSREVQIELGEIAVSYDSCRKPKGENA